MPVFKLFCLLLCVFSLWGCGQRQGGKTSESQPTESPNHEMLSYEIGDAEVAITGYNLFEEGELVIPAQIEGLPVTSIEGAAFSSCSLTSVRIPQGVTSIGDTAFLGCDGLTSISIPQAFHSEVEASRLGLDKLWPDGFALPDSSSK